MRIVVLSDTHTFHDEIEMPEGDIVIHCGDYSHTGAGDEVYSFLDWFKRLPYKHKIFINGNHELNCEKNPYLFEAVIPKEVHYLQDSAIELEGLKFYGSPRTPEFFNWAYMYKRHEARKIWDQIPKDTDVLITHGPPHQILDYSFFKMADREDQHVGCKVLKTRVKEVMPKLHCFGHIHGGYGTLRPANPQFDVLFVNASICDESYRASRNPVVVDTTFWSVL